MLFELRIRFSADEGDEMVVIDMDEEITHFIESNSNVKIRDIKLACGGNYYCKEGRGHATSN